jgi:mono/diheme cytochrome c family protein
MKKQNLLMLSMFALTAVAFFLLTGFNADVRSEKTFLNPEETFAIPEDIQTIFDKSCFGCHNVEATSDKAKKKLLIDQMQELSKAKLVAALGDIAEVVEKGDMPPQKFLDKYPDKALTQEEAAKVKEWAETTADELLK